MQARWRCTAILRVGIAGVTGYTGAELVRLLERHPRVQIVAGTTEQYRGQRLGNVYPHLRWDAPDDPANLELSGLDAAALAACCDVAFAALPHGVAIDVAPVFLAAGKRFIDLGADFRLQDGGAYQSWYKHAPAAPEVLSQAVYGLPELFRERIRGSRLVANPGCYPTSCALAAAPLLMAGVVETRGIIFDSKSGVSGAGRGVSLGVHFSEVNENFKPYSIAGNHRHTPEIEQTLSAVAGTEIRVTFTPHLLPITRGILTTAYFQLKQDLAADAVRSLFRECYAGEPFVRIRPAGDLPQTKQVQGANFCDIGVEVDSRTGRVIVVAAIDNLVKGASGQAIQNLNLMMGWPETTGLTGLGLYP